MLGILHIFHIERVLDAEALDDPKPYELTIPDLTEEGEQGVGMGPE